jgi:hypothetical protein
MGAHIALIVASNKEDKTTPTIPICFPRNNESGIFTMAPKIPLYSCSLSLPTPFWKIEKIAHQLFTIM